MSSRGALTALLSKRADGKLELGSPAVGEWREVPPAGSLVAAGMRVGRIEVLGVLSEIIAPVGGAGIVVTVGGDAARARRPVGYGTTLLVLDPELGVQHDAASADRVSERGGELIFRAPTSGRFYARPSPGKPPFVAPGDTVNAGQTVAILEVMKTYSRIAYGGTGLPPRARVVRVVPADGDDLESGQPILEVEPA